MAVARLLGKALFVVDPFPALPFRARPNVLGRSVFWAVMASRTAYDPQTATVVDSDRQMFHPHRKSRYRCKLLKSGIYVVGLQSSFLHLTYERPPGVRGYLTCLAWKRPNRTLLFYLQYNSSAAHRRLYPSPLQIICRGGPKEVAGFNDCVVPAGGRELAVPTVGPSPVCGMGRPPVRRRSSLRD